MKIEVNEYDMKRIMEEMDRDYFTLEALTELMEYYDDDEIFDPVRICCEWDEFGEHGAALTFDDLIDTYGYVYPRAEWEEDFATYPDLTEEDYFDDLIVRLEDRTTVIHLPNGNYLIAEF